MATSYKQPLISVVICTYNRSRLLINCLESIKCQLAAPKSFETIIVDNNSNDDTKKICQAFIQNDNSIRYVFEKRQGISFARNRGYQEARGKYIAYIDDDAVAYKNWVINILNFLNRNPKVNIFGGPYNRFSIGKIPDWFPQDYGKLDLGNKERILNVGREWITESNLVIKKKYLKQIGGFSTGFGHIGNKIAYGEGPDLLIRSANKGGQIYYVPKIKVKHLVSDNKFSVWWLLHSDFERGRASKKFPQLSNQDFSKLSSSGKVLWSFFYYLFKINKLPFKKAFYLGCSGLAGLLGYTYESFVGSRWRK